MVKIDNRPGPEIGGVFPVAARFEVKEHDAAGDILAVKILKPAATGKDKPAAQSFGTGGFRGKGIGEKWLDGSFSTVDGQARPTEGAYRGGEALASGYGLQL